VSRRSRTAVALYKLVDAGAGRVSYRRAEPLPGFPLGLLVTHDRENAPDPDERASTNFKYTRLERVAAALLFR
jgi:myo-inositol-hexaphosphate 3-phosphohydrolase